jgi:hypothetical protein
MGISVWYTGVPHRLNICQLKQGSEPMRISSGKQILSFIPSAFGVIMLPSPIKVSEPIANESKR